jgi:undecaprenyl-diphosphatase
MNEIWSFISLFGSPEAGLILAIFLFLLWLWLRRKAKRPRLKGFLLLYISSLAAFLLLAFVIKTIWPIPRPCMPDVNCPSDPSFPSGHAGTAFIIAMAASFFIKKRTMLLLYSYAALIAISRLLLGVHTPFDVIGGALLAIAIVFLFNRKLYKS